MKQLKIYLGAVALMLLATQCNLLPWPPYVDPIVPIVDPIIASDYNVAVGDFITIDLRSGGTGCQWQWDNKEACTSVDSVGFNFLPDYRHIGSSGMEIWKFKGVQTGVDTLLFTYHSVLDNGAQDSTKTVIINVTNGHIGCK